MGSSIFGTVIGSPTKAERETGDAAASGGERAAPGELTYGCDGLAEGHDAPGAAEEQAAAMKQTGGKAEELLQPLLPHSPAAALLKNHLLVGIVLSK